MLKGWFNKKDSKAKSVAWRDENGKLRCLGDNCELKVCPKECPIWQNTVVVGIMQLKQFERAIDEYKKIISTDPDFYDAWNNSAVCYGSLGNYQKAYECYSKAHELLPEKPAPIFGLALASKDLEKYAECIKWCDQFRKLTGSNELIVLRSQAYAALYGPDAKDDSQENDESVPPHRIEFERDIKALMDREDIQSRDEIVKAEFAKAIALATEKTEDKLHRAFDIMGNLGMDFEYLPAIFWMGSFCESVVNDYEQAAFWFKKGADLGHGNCARNYADVLMQYTDNPDKNEIIHYYTIAAESGIPEAAFVCGEFARKAGDLSKARQYYQQAADAGYDPAQVRLNQLQS